MFLASFSSSSAKSKEHWHAQGTAGTLCSMTDVDAVIAKLLLERFFKSFVAQPVSHLWRGGGGAPRDPSAWCAVDNPNL